MGTQSTTQQELFFISVAAEMLGMHPETLRKYEGLGLVQPSRTIGSRVATACFDRALAPGTSDRGIPGTLASCSPCRRGCRVRENAVIFNA